VLWGLVGFEGNPHNVQLKVPLRKLLLQLLVVNWELLLVLFWELEVE